MELHDETFEGMDVLLDGNQFFGCSFRDSRLIFEGKDGSTMVACTFYQGAEIVLANHAATTLKFLASLYQLGGEHWPKFVEQVFDQVRSGRFDVDRK